MKYLDLDDALEEEDVLIDIERNLLIMQEQSGTSFEQGLKLYIEWVEEMGKQAIKEVKTGKVALY